MSSSNLTMILSSLLVALVLGASPISGFLIATPSSSVPLRTCRTTSVRAHDSNKNINDDDESSPIHDRRQVLVAALSSSLMAFVGTSFSTPASAAGDASAFVGTYTDPINHPGGTRTISLLPDQTVGDYQLAQVEGGGGVGEPKSYVLPAVVLGDRAIVIDFSPKGGPRDFTAVLDGTKGIKFLRDGNQWPKIS